MKQNSFARSDCASSIVLYKEETIISQTVDVIQYTGIECPSWECCHLARKTDLCDLCDVTWDMLARRPPASSMAAAH